MSRQSQDREDLLRDATALVPRLMLRVLISGDSCEVFAGFRGEALSLYFGADPVYQFNSVGELRRAFVDGVIVKAESGVLSRWRQERSTDEVAMHSRSFPAAETAEFLKAANARIAELRTALDAGEFELVGHVPGNAEGFERLKAALTGLTDLRIADAANVR